MSDFEIRYVLLSTDDIGASIDFYRETLGFELKFRDGDEYARLDSQAVAIALTTAAHHPLPGQAVVSIRTADVDGAAKSIEDGGGSIVRAPHDRAHERLAVVKDNKGNGLLFYGPLPSDT